MLDFHGVQFPICYASCSIGHDDSKHTLPEKLKAIAGARFDAIELSMPDMLAYGQHLSKNDSQINPTDYATLRSVGKDIKKLCDKEGLKVLILQPFANFEGWPKGSHEREDAFERAKGWMGIMEAVGTDMLQVSGRFQVLFSNSVASAAEVEVGDNVADQRTRSVRLMPKESHQISMRWPPTSPSLQISLQRKASRSRTRIGVGRLMPQPGRTFGKWYRRRTDQTWVCAWILSKVPGVNGETRQRNPD